MERKLTGWVNVGACFFFFFSSPTTGNVRSSVEDSRGRVYRQCSPAQYIAFPIMTLN